MEMEARSLSGGFTALALVGLLISTYASATCNFPAVYNFGDSNSDTGASSVALMPIPPPYGMTFFKKPAKRMSDGRVILSAYLDSIGPNFRHGANFAASGASILPGPLSPFDLNIQLSQFSQFKARTTQLFQNLSGTSFQYMLPNPGEFEKALYTVDIGQNDLNVAFQSKTWGKIVAEIPRILDQFTKGIQHLYGEGARSFWIHNTGPLGCLPIMALTYKFRNGTLDKNGCDPSVNQVSQAFNTQDVMAGRFLETIVTFACTGFVRPIEFCCGQILPAMVMCGTSAVVNGTAVAGTACKDPQKRISWDAIHYTEAANRWVSWKVLGGDYSHPRVPISGACP